MAAREEQQLEAQGYALAEGLTEQVLPQAERTALFEEAPRRIDPQDAAVRSFLALPRVAELVRTLLGPLARPVRAMAFDKSASSNWLVPWHQDRVIAVKQRDERAKVSHWTAKQGVPHCEPPVAFLERMLTLRWHPDAVGREDGCLRVMAGSHRLGRLDHEAIAERFGEEQARDLTMPAGSLLIMRPLLVHASRRRQTEGRRRVLHIELAAEAPPRPLEWAFA